MVPNDSSVWAALAGLALSDEFAVRFMKHLDSLVSADRDILVTPYKYNHVFEFFTQFLMNWTHTMDRRKALRNFAGAATAASLFRGIDLDE